MIDTALAAILIWLATTGGLMYLRLPLGSGAETIWGMSRHEWGQKHFWLAVSFLALSVLHVALHMGWLSSVVREQYNSSKARTLIWAGVMLAMILIASLVLAGPREQAGHGGRGFGQHRRGEYR